MLWIALAELVTGEGGAVRFYFPIVLCIIVSVVVTIVLNVIIRLR